MAEAAPELAVSFVAHSGAAVADVGLLMAFFAHSGAAVADVGLLMAFFAHSGAAVADVELLMAFLAHSEIVPGLYTSAADAVTDLPNSGASSPFKSNRDAARALK